MRDVRMTDDVRHNARTDERPGMYRGRRTLFSESSAGEATVGAVATPAAAAVAPATRECASVERHRPQQRRQDALHVEVRAPGQRGERPAQADGQQRPGLLLFQQQQRHLARPERPAAKVKFSGLTQSSQVDPAVCLKIPLYAP
jgi:hypothetical protein